MTLEIFPINLATFIFVFVFTFFFDLLDLRPQIGSFKFIASTTYFAYYIIRAIFGILASVLLQLTGLFQNEIVLAFVAVVASVTLLYNFSLKLGGENVADLPRLFESYRSKMVEDELNRASRGTLAAQIKLTYDLSEKLDVKELEKHTLTCLHVPCPEYDAKNTVQDQIGEINKIAGSDNAVRKLLLAQAIVNTSPEYAEQLLRPPQKSS